MGQEAAQVTRRPHRRAGERRGAPRCGVFASGGRGRRGRPGHVGRSWSTPLSSAQRQAQRVARDDLAIQQQSAEGANVGRTLAGIPRATARHESGRRESRYRPTSRPVRRSWHELNRQAPALTALVASARLPGPRDRARCRDEARSTMRSSACRPLRPASAIGRSDRAARRQRARCRGTTRGARFEHRARRVIDSRTQPDVEFVIEQDRRRLRALDGWIGAALARGGTRGRPASAARAAAHRQRVHDEEARRRHYETEVYQAIDLATTEAAVYDVVGRTLRETAPSLDVELLIADSSRAHFQRALASHADGANGVRRRFARRLSRHGARTHDAVPVERGDQRVPVPARPLDRSVLGSVHPGQHRREARSA